MPVKRVDDLKNRTDREAGQDWQKALNIKNLTTSEWNYAGERGARGASDTSIRNELLKIRKASV